MMTDRLQVNFMEKLFLQNYKKLTGKKNRGLLYILIL